MAGLTIEGLNSGLNTTEIVEAIIQVERQNAVLLEVEQAQKQTLISAYQSLQAKFISLSTELTQLTKRSLFEATKFNVSDETVLSASSTGRVASGTFDLQVLSLARNHQIASQGFSSDSLTSFGVGTITLKLGDGAEKTITITAENNSLVEIKEAINQSGAGVNASIVNDGSGTNPYRLVLTGSKTGAANKITVTSSLTGGTNFNFSTAVFDSPEAVSMNAGSTSQISLGSTSAYSGNTNKIYTFTVAGTGEQTIGSDNITINWSDGVNTGSIVVSEADTEVELAGVGADGLKLSFANGTLNAGDSIQVSTFAPLLQEASDAKITIGSSGGLGSPIVVTSKSNTFTNVISNVTLTVSKLTEAGKSVTITTGMDTEAVKGKINSFISAYNELNKYIDEQNKFDKDAETSPPLFGDYTVWSVQNSLRRNASSVISGISTKFNQLYSIGIRTNASGQLYLADSSRLSEALENNLDDVIKLFISDGDSSNSGIEFLAATDKTKSGLTHEVDITQAASHGGFSGAEIANPSSTPITLSSTNNRLKLKVDGLVSDELILRTGSYETIDELIEELQVQIDSDAKIGNRGVTVEWIETTSGQGYIKMTASSYGATSKVEIDKSISSSAHFSLGFDGGQYFVGKDVAGTINGEEAVGVGQILTGKEGNATTEGLKLKITLSETEVTDGVEGTISVTKGVATRQLELVNNLTKSSGGLIDRRIKAFQNQIDFMTKRIEDIDKYLALRRESLYKKYQEMETALGALQSQSSYLTSQLNSINANWK